MQAGRHHPHYPRILATQIVLLFITAVMQDHIVMNLLFVLGLFGIYGALIGAVWEKRAVRFLAIAFGAVAFVGALPALLPGFAWEVQRVTLTVSCSSYVAFFSVAIFSISRNVFVTDRVTSNLIMGSIVLYLLIGMLFAFVYALFDLVAPGAVHIPASSGPAVGKLSDFLYFSFSTLTTTGYGDAVPVNSLAKMVASLEGVTGSIYLAIVVARLVGMHVMQKREG